MQSLAPVGTVYQAGTLGQPDCDSRRSGDSAAGDPQLYDQLDRTAGQLRAEVGFALDAAGVPHVIQNALGTCSASSS